MKRLFYLIALVLATQAKAQKSTKMSDSVHSYSYSQLKSRSYDKGTFRAKARQWANVWMEKAKAEENVEQQVAAIQAMMHAAPKAIRLQLNDSLVNTAINTSNPEIIASACLTAGAACYDNRKQTQALDYFLTADKYLTPTENEYLKYKVKYAIAGTKYYLGFYEEAIALYRQCIEYFAEENDTAYLKSLHAISLCYIRTDKYEWAEQYIELGKRTASETDQPNMVAHFQIATGTLACFEKNYQRAIMETEKGLNRLKTSDDYAAKTMAYSILGRAQAGAGHIEKAMLHFKEMDKLMRQFQYCHPELRRDFEFMIDYHKSKNQNVQQLYFVNRLLETDKILNRDYKYLSAKLYKEYDTRQLMEDKRSLEAELRKRNINNKTAWVTIGALAGILAVISIIVVIQKRRKYKIKKTARPKKITAPIDPDMEMKTEVAETIATELKKFEDKQKYLQKNLTAVKVAAMLNTNTKYLAKVIQHYKGKTFITYLNDLKINYVIELLNTHSKYRNYTNKALGDEAGFGSTQIFTQVFKATTGLSPTAYIQKLNEND